MKRQVFTTFLFLSLAILVPQHAADVGMGLSGNNQELVIESFPFTFESMVTIFNTGDRDAIFTISVLGEGKDIASWIDVEKNIVSLHRGEYCEVKYAVRADEGYSGKYIARIVVTGFDEPLDKDDPSSTPMCNAKNSGSIELSIHVTEQAGASSLGTAPSPTNVQESTSYFENIVDCLYEADAGVVLHPTGMPIYLDIPETIKIGEVASAETGYIGHGESDDLGIILLSPSEGTYHLKSGEGFKFEEAGTWGVLITVSGTPVIGRSVEVIEGRESNSLPMSAIPIFGMMLAVGAMFASRRHIS